MTRKNDLKLLALLELSVTLTPREVTVDQFINAVLTASSAAGKS